jgi:hypothetical protein
MAGQVIEAVPMVLSIILWFVVLLSVCSVAYWAYLLVVVGRGYDSPSPEHGPSAVQVRLLTVDSAAIVQESVDAIPDSITDRHVIAEEPMNITGATVHVVPDAFECEAIRKGRALEWARRNVPCEREYVLYLDEDSIMTDFEGVPDADVVQFRERPRRSGSWLTYLAEIFRMGFQVEQRAFPSLRVPLYAWGGGIAIRNGLEDRITWETPTMIEDTTFVWNAAAEGNVDFALARAKFDTQAPPTVRAMVSQRSRWLAGSQRESGLLAPAYRLLTTVRNLAWALSPAVPFLTLVPLFVPGTVIFETAFQVVSVLVFSFVLVWSVLGVRYYDESWLVGLGLIVLSPIVSLLHSLGAFVGLISPPTDFSVTRKVKPELVERTEREAESD